MNNKLKKHQVGFTLGELGLVLLIVAIIAMFAYPKFIEYNDSVLAGEEADNIIQYVSKTKSAYSMNSDFDGLTTESLVKSGVFPPSMIKGDNTVVNNYQGVVTAALNGGNNTVTFTSTNYSQAGCQEVVSRIASVASTISVGAQMVKKAANEKLDRANLGACIANSNVVFTISK